MKDELDEGAARDLALIRRALEPHPGAAARVISAALESGQRRRGRRALAAGFAAVAIAAGVALAIRSRDKTLPAIRMGNSGGVVFVETGRGERWAISGSHLAGQKLEIVGKGEGR